MLHNLMIQLFHIISISHPHLSFLLDFEDGDVSVVAPGVDVKLPVQGVNGDLNIRGGGRSERGLGKLEKIELIRME